MGKDLKGKELGVGISQRKDLRYQYRYKDDEGNRKTKYADTEREIKRLKKDIEYNLCHDVYKVNTRLTLNAWFEFWLDTIKGKNIKKKTRKNYKYSYNIIADYLGMIYMDDITSAMCATLFKSLELKYSGNTLEGIKKLLNTMYKDAIDFGMDIKNPISSKIKIPKDKNKRIALTEDETTEFLEEAKKSVYYNFLAFALETGMRCGEICALSIDDIDLEKREIHVVRNMEIGNDEADFYDDDNIFSTPKTDAGTRIVPMTTECVEIVYRQIAIVSTYPKCKGYENLLFKSKSGKMYLGTDILKGIRRIVSRINENRRENSLPDFPKMNVHACRHTFATRCARAGMPVKVLQLILGHASDTTTSKYYIHLNTDDLHEGLKYIDKRVAFDNFCRTSNILPFNVQMYGVKPAVDGVKWCQN